MKNSILSWSSGKDSALAMYYAQKDPNINLVSLMTTLSEKYQRISMHGVQKEFLEKQAGRMDLSLELIYLPADCSNEVYNSIMEQKMKKLKEGNINTVIFGDIFLEDIRTYREENLSKVNMNAHFPLWGISTEKLAHKFIDLGFKAVITCVDSEYLDKRFIGREYNTEFLSDLPKNVDPCGENGEFHSFVYDGPLFNKAISYKLGKVVFQDNQFYFIDLLEKKEQS